MLRIAVLSLLVACTGAPASDPAPAASDAPADVAVIETPAAPANGALVLIQETPVSDLTARMANLKMEKTDCSHPEGDFDCTGERDGIFYRMVAVDALNPDVREAELAKPGVTKVVGDYVVRVDAIDKGAALAAFEACAGGVDEMCAITALEGKGFVHGGCVPETEIKCTMKRGNAVATLAFVTGPTLSGTPEFNGFKGSFSLADGATSLEVGVTDADAAAKFMTDFGF
ncbi:MAG: hypothetical protein ACI9MC_000238 [Kiritimatiellia bacterium]|jgi:hypothetical protein